jgi:hypothetical protein
MALSTFTTTNHRPHHHARITTLAISEALPRSRLTVHSGHQHLLLSFPHFLEEIYTINTNPEQT